MEIVLLDSNILIEILKGNKETISKIKRINGIFAISIISSMELIYGAFNKEEIRKIEKFLLNFKVVEIDSKISIKALDLIKRYAKSHFLDIPDALIASTAIVNNYKLFTYNLKDFKYINGLEILI